MRPNLTVQPEPRVHAFALGSFWAAARLPPMFQRTAVGHTKHKPMNRLDHSHVAAEPLLRAAFGAQTAQILYVASKLGIADKLHQGESSASELARSLGVDAS